MREVAERVDMSFQEMMARVMADHRGQRVCSFEFQGRKYWLKQVERPKGAMRLLKGNSRQALRKEISVLERLGAVNAPVPRLVQVGQDYFVVEDVGKTVNQWLQDPSLDSAEVQAILNDSALALARLHSMQLAHGRPALRDIGWAQGQVTFIDFEANQAGSNLMWQQIRDLLVYIHSLYRYMGKITETTSGAIEEAIGHYRRAGGEVIWHCTRAALDRVSWLYYLLRPFKEFGGRDLRPVYWVLRHFRQGMPNDNADVLGHSSM